MFSCLFIDVMTGMFECFFPCQFKMFSSKDPLNDLDADFTNLEAIAVSKGFQHRAEKDQGQCFHLTFVTQIISSLCFFLVFFFFCSYCILMMLDIIIILCLCLVYCLNICTFCTHTNIHSYLYVYL